MNIKFTKMHGLGNDFMVIDAVNQRVQLSTRTIRALSRRDTGVGFDQCLLVKPSHLKEIDFLYKIYNADGSEVGQCGNGARCLARFIHYYRLIEKREISVATSTIQMHLTINPDNSVTVSMGRPTFHPSTIPFLTPEEQTKYSLPISNDESCEFYIVNVGNPHAIMLVSDINEVDVSSLGKFLSEHPRFPEGTNVGFMQIIHTNLIKLRVYERGCGETSACGSGAVAAALVGRLHHHLSKTIEVDLPGGQLLVHWPNKNSNVYLTGPAVFVYEGRLM